MSGKVCPMFLQGSCKFGKKCRNLHEKQYN